MRSTPRTGGLRAVHYGMVQGLTAGQAVGWGQSYFATDYTEDVANERARETRDLVMQRGIDQVLAVPTEPLAKLATATPHEGLITPTTIGIANFALWRLRVFNQLVVQLTDFNTKHAVEITSSGTDASRREDIAAAAMSFVVVRSPRWDWPRVVVTTGWRTWLVRGSSRRARLQHERTGCEAPRPRMAAMASGVALSRSRRSRGRWTHRGDHVGFRLTTARSSTPSRIAESAVSAARDGAGAAHSTQSLEPEGGLSRHDLLPSR
jgi:hypothetical protein